MDTFNITLCRGPKRLETAVSSQMTVSDLKSDIEEKLSVLSQSQKLLYKGKALSEDTASLADVGLQEGARVMVLGKVYKIETDETFQEILKIHSDCEASAKEADDISNEVEDVGNANMNEDSKKRLTELDKKLMFLSEGLMKKLETLDGMQIQFNIPAVRTQRKTTVQQIQAIMDRIDQTSQIIKNRVSER